LRDLKDLDRGRRLVIAIDGPAASGKSTAARALALRLGYLYLDTGALYRAVTWKVIDEKIDAKDVAAIASLCQRLEIKLSVGEEMNEVWVDGVNITSYLRLPDISALSSTISQLPPVRDKLLSVQQEYGRFGGLVAEGRDIGTVIFPDADLKFYLDADLSIRGTRRYKDLSGNGLAVDLSETTKDLNTRDQKDRARPISPLRKGDDAIVIDSTQLNANEVLEKMLEEVERVPNSI